MRDLLASDLPGHPAPSHEPRGDASVDVLRKLAIVAALVLAYVFLHRFATPSPDFDPRGLLALGFVILAAFSVGELAEVVKLPHITGYLIAGVVLGPSMAHLAHEILPALPAPFDEGVLNARVKEQLSLFDDLALALIALTAGGEMHVETIRKGLRKVLTIASSQVVMITAAVSLLMFALSGPVPFLRIDEFAALPKLGVAGIAAVIATLAVARSPAVTIAVINGTGAKGETTDTVLSVVVLVDVIVVTMFSVATVFASSMLGADADPSAVWMSALHIVGSVVVGVSLGLLILAYLRYVGAEILLFLVSVVYATAYLCDQWHLELALVFILAGFTVANLGQLGDRLIHGVERLSLPVYVVFFTLAGSKLHLDIVWEMLAFAVTLALVRVGGLVLGTRLGARLSGAGPTMEQYGWMCFVSQAGLAISLASTLPTALPGAIGDRLFALGLSTIALNEMFGPVLLQWGLTLSGDVGSPRAAAVSVTPAADAPEPTDRSARVWGPPAASRAPEVDAAIAGLELSLRALVEELRAGPLSDARDAQEELIAELRRDLLRGHRNLMVAAQSGVPEDELPGRFVEEIATLGEAWRDRLLGRSRQLGEGGWRVAEVVDRLDALVATLPEGVRAEVEPDALAPREEAAWRRLARAALRARVRLGGTRTVDLRALGRYHLGGRGPAQLERVPARLLWDEARLGQQISEHFGVAVAGWEGHAERVARGEVDREELVLALVALRRELEDGFALLSRHIDVGAEAAATGLEDVLGGLVRAIKEDALKVGTVDLPGRARRYRRVFAERNLGLRALGAELAGARHTVAAGVGAIALDVELVALEGRTRLAVERHADQLARDLRARGWNQVERLDAALDAWLASLEGLLAAPGTTTVDLSARMRQGAEEVGRVAREALLASQGLRAELAGDEAAAPLLRTLLDAARSLSEWYAIPSAPVPDGGDRLPPAVATLEVPFRDLTVAYIESNVTLALSRRSNALADAVGTLVEQLAELDRVTVFNVELAASELDVLPTDQPLSPETRVLVGEMLVGAVGRTHQRLRRLGDEVQGWPDRGRADVRTAVLAALSELRGQVIAGRLGDVWTRLFGERRARRGLLRPADWSGLANEAREQVEGVVLQALGTDRVEQARQVLGLRSTGLDEVELRAALLAPSQRVKLPVVYRRLFSERALEAGDLTIGREVELAAAQAALAPGSRLRSAAIVGVRGTGTSSLATAATRAWSGRVRRLDLEQPVGVDDVRRWFADQRSDELTVLTGVRFTFQLRPGGFAPLEELARQLAEHAEHHPWILTADAEVWNTACGLVALHDAVGAVVRLGPLGVGDLEAAVLARHQMSGFELTFDAANDLGWQLAHLSVRDGDGEARRRRAWFRTLHEACDGIVHDGLRLWLASIAEVDPAGARIRVGPVPRPPVARLSALDDETLLILVQLVRQGWMDADVFSALFRVSPATATVRLVALVHRGLLVEPVPGRFDLAPHLRGPVHRALRVRGWL